MTLASASPNRRKKAAAKAPAQPAALSPDTIQAYLSCARPMQPILFEARDAGGYTTLAALVDRRNGQLAFIAESKRLDSAELDTLRSLARGTGKPLTPVSLAEARLGLVRAILATRIAGGDLPSWLAERFAVGDATMTRIDDIYHCGTCDAPLPMREQLAFADAVRAPDRAPEIGALRCPCCRGEASRAESPGEVWLDRAWLMLAAGLPRRALVCAARAEGMRAAEDQLESLRAAVYVQLTP